MQKVKVLNRARDWWSKPYRVANLQEFVVKHAPMVIASSGRKQLLGYLKHGLTLQFDAEVQAVMQIVAPGSTIIDVGSNVGKFAEPFLERGYTVISIDPLPQAIKKQKAKFSHYLAENKLYLHNVACSDEAGVETLYVSTDTNGCYSSLKKSWAKEVYRQMWAGQTIAVSKICLSELIHRHVSSGKPYPVFVKIDTEGYEYEVLLGLFSDLSLKHCPMLIMFEFHAHPANQKNFESCINLLKDNDYQDFKFFIRYWDMLIYESDWTEPNIDVNAWNNRQGVVPAGLRYGNIIARRN